MNEGTLFDHIHSEIGLVVIVAIHTQPTELETIITFVAIHCYSKLLYLWFEAIDDKYTNYHILIWTHARGFKVFYFFSLTWVSGPACSHLD
jgi:hypothetical protein